MTAGAGDLTVPGRLCRPSPSRFQKMAQSPSGPRTDGSKPSVPVLSDPGRTGRLISLCITTRHFINHIGLSYSPKICYIIELSKSLYIYTYRDPGIREMDSVTGSIYLGDPGEDRHDPIIRITHSIFLNS
jgi:hypothetical protein